MTYSFVEAVVTVCMSELGYVKLETGNGQTLAISDCVRGVDWRQLEPGDRLRCKVIGFGTTVQARLLERSAALHNESKK